MKPTIAILVLCAASCWGQACEATAFPGNSPCTDAIIVRVPQPSPLPLLDPHRLQRNTGILDGLFSEHKTHPEVDVCIRDEWPDTPTCNLWARQLLAMMKRNYTPVAKEIAK